MMDNIPGVDAEKLENCGLSVAEILAVANYVNDDYKLFVKRVRPKIVCLCGSTKFKDAFMDANRDETLKGNVVLSVGVFGHAEGLVLDEDTKTMLDSLHFRKIDLADEILFLNVDGYIGESTSRELEYSKKNEKVIRFLEDNVENLQ